MITSKNFDVQLDSILQNWESWRIYDLSFIRGLGMSLKIPKNFNPKMFESKNSLTIFENDFTFSEKAKTIALDIARLNYKRLQKELKDGKLNLRLICCNKGINLGEGVANEEEMLLKLNTLTYAKIIEEMTQEQENNLKNQRQNSSQGGMQTSKKNINRELMRIYDLYSHIHMTNVNLEGCEEGLPLTAEDIEKFGLEEDITNIAKRGKNVFQEIIGEEEKVKVYTDIGEMRIINCDQSNPITSKNSNKTIELKEDDEGVEILNSSWLESIRKQNEKKEVLNYKWFSAKILKDVLNSIKIKNKEEVKEKKVFTNSPSVINNIPIFKRGSLRGRGFRGSRGSRGSREQRDI